MIMNDEEANARLSSPDNLMNRLVEIRKLNPGHRQTGSTAIPDKVRELIGYTANNSEETNQQIADSFGVTQPLVSTASRGLISGSKARFDPDLRDATQATNSGTKADTAHELALDAMVKSLELLTPKLETIDKPERLARIAGEMSRISANIKPTVAVQQNVQVILFKPNQKKESDFEAIAV